MTPDRATAQRVLIHGMVPRVAILTKARGDWHRMSEEETSGWKRAEPLVAPVAIEVTTPLSAEAAVAAIAGALLEERYWDPKRSESPFLRLAGSQVGLDVDLSAVPYVLPGVRARGLRLTIRGKLEPSGSGCLLTAAVSTPDPWLGLVPLVGETALAWTHKLLVAEATGVQELLADILRG